MSEVEQDMARLRAAAEALGEHFDTVQIFATRHESDGTRAVNVGAGNWYARFGHVQEWLATAEERSAASIWREENEEED